MTHIVWKTKVFAKPKKRVYSRFPAGPFGLSAGAVAAARSCTATTLPVNSGVRYTHPLHMCAYVCSLLVACAWKKRGIGHNIHTCAETCLCALPAACVQIQNKIKHPRASRTIRPRYVRSRTRVRSVRCPMCRSNWDPNHPRALRWLPFCMGVRQASYLCRTSAGLRSWMCVFAGPRNPCNPRPRSSAAGRAGCFHHTC